MRPRSASPGSPCTAAMTSPSSLGATPCFCGSAVTLTSTRTGSGPGRSAERTRFPSSRAMTLESTAWTTSAAFATSFALFVCRCPMKCHSISGRSASASRLAAELLRVVLPERALPRRVGLADRLHGLRLRHRDELDPRGSRPHAAAARAIRPFTSSSPSRTLIARAPASSRASRARTRPSRRSFGRAVRRGNPLPPCPPRTRCSGGAPPTPAGRTAGARAASSRLARGPRRAPFGRACAVARAARTPSTTKRTCRARS